MVELDSTLATVYFLGLMTVRALAAQWLVLPEYAFVASLYPDLTNDRQKYTLERFVHVSNMAIYGMLIFAYAGKPKLWSNKNFGWLLVLLFLHHAFEQLTHELLPKTNISFLVGNTVWTTFAVVVLHLYCITNGYYDTFYRLAAEPFFVFMAIILEITETHAGCTTNWTLGNPLRDDDVRTGYLTTNLGTSERMVLFIVIHVGLGLVVKEYFKVHDDAAKSLKTKAA